MGDGLPSLAMRVQEDPNFGLARHMTVTSSSNLAYPIDWPTDEPPANPRARPGAMAGAKDSSPQATRDLRTCESLKSF